MVFAEGFSFDFSVKICDWRVHNDRVSKRSEMSKARWLVALFNDISDSNYLQLETFSLEEVLPIFEFGSDK